MITIPLKHSKTHWVDFENSVKFKVGYLTLEQKDILKERLVTLAFIDSTLPEKGELSKELPAEEKAKLLTLSEKYHRLFLKYTIKDWQGIVNDKGKPVKLELITNESDPEQGTEMNTDQWIGLCKSLTPDQLATHWAKINREVVFDETDKKK